MWVYLNKVISLTTLVFIIKRHSALSSFYVSLLLIRFYIHFYFFTVLEKLFKCMNKTLY